MPVHEGVLDAGAMEADTAASRVRTEEGNTERGREAVLQGRRGSGESGERGMGQLFPRYAAV
jgi:hypothetical protein